MAEQADGEASFVGGSFTWRNIMGDVFLLWNHRGLDPLLSRGLGTRVG